MTMTQNNSVDVLSNTKYYELIKNRKVREHNRPKKITQEQKDLQTKKWTTFYRRNIAVYAENRLRVKLKPFQRIMIYLMSQSDTFMAICSRGLSKSWLVALYAICKCLLYPFSEVVITSSTIDQANKIVSNKIQKELIGKLSPVLKWMYEQDLITISYPKDCAIVKFTFNGSTITVMPALDSSRGERATVLIAEECRLIKKTIWDAVFVKMAHPRQAEYLQMPEYEKDPRLLEQCQEIYITSAYFKSEWFWRSFINTVRGFYNDHSVKYNFYGGDIFTAIHHGLKTMTDLRKSKQDSGEIEFRMEDLNEMIGEAPDAYFTLDMVRNNQILRKAFRPPTALEFNSNIDLKNSPKKQNEKRIIWVDFAWASQTGREKNDNTVIGCLSLFLKEENKFDISFDYMETHTGDDTLKAQKRIRELYFDYDADYIVPDIRSAGEVIIRDELSAYWENPERPSDRWNPHGLTMCREMDLHVVPEGKVTNFKSIDPEAIPCVIPFIATAELNNSMWVTLRKTLVDGHIRFLIDEIEYEKELDAKKSFTMDSDEKMRAKIPFVQQSLLINELINLTPTWDNNGKVKMTENRSATKDRAVAFGMGILLARKLATKYAIESNTQDFNTDDWADALL